MTDEACKRKVKYEDNNWPKYESIMNANGYTLIFKPDVNGSNITPYHNLMLGDGIWFREGELSFRDLKACGKKYHCPVSKNSFRSFPTNGIYDFYDPYFTHKVYSVAKKELISLFNSGEYTEEKELYRFKFNTIVEIGISYGL